MVVPPYFLPWHDRIQSDFWDNIPYLQAFAHMQCEIKMHIHPNDHEK
jgi:hypothetical protein